MKPGILGEMEVARSLPIRLLRRIASEIDIVVEGPFATELQNELLHSASAIDAQARTRGDGYVTTDLAQAIRLFSQPAELMRLAFSTKRFVLLPWVCDVDQLVAAVPDEGMTAMGVDDQNAWAWCNSENGVCVVNVYSFHTQPVDAEVSFRLVQANSVGRKIALNGTLLTSPDGHVCITKRLAPGKTPMHFSLTNNAPPVRVGGQPMHYSVYNFRVMIANHVPQGFRGGEQVLNEFVVREAMHAAGFQFVTWKALTRASDAEETAEWSRGICFEPRPFRLDDRFAYSGSLMKMGTVYWFLGVNTAGDVARWGPE